MTHASVILARESPWLGSAIAEHVDEAEWWPLSFTQEAYLLAYEVRTLASVPRIYTHFPIALRIRGPLDLGGLQTALHTVLARHRGLTAAYHATDVYDDRQRFMMLRLFDRTRIFVPGLFAQWMYPNAQVRIHHRSAAPASAPLDEQELARVAEDEAGAPLDTGSAPVVRASAISFDRSNHLLVLTVSHLVVDGWSAAILRDELMALYSVSVLERPCTLPAVTAHSGTLAVIEHQRFRSGELRRDAEYWGRQWLDAADSTIRHSDMPCATGRARQQGSVRAVRGLVHATESQLIRRLAGEDRITPYAFFRAALTILLHRYTGRRRIAFWANFANRRDPRFARLIASCARPHVVPVDLSPTVTVRELCHAIARRLAEAQKHEAVPEAALPLLGVSRMKPREPCITFDAWPAPRARSSGAIVEPVLVAGGRPWVNLDVRFRDEGESFALYLTFNDGQFHATGVRAMLEDLAQLVSDLARKIDGRISDFSSARWS